jgi:hypothetical protein
MGQRIHSGVHSGVQDPQPFGSGRDFRLGISRSVEGLRVKARRRCERKCMPVREKVGSRHRLSTAVLGWSSGGPGSVPLCLCAGGYWELWKLGPYPKTTAHHVRVAPGQSLSEGRGWRTNSAPAPLIRGLWSVQTPLAGKRKTPFTDAPPALADVQPVRSPNRH